MPREVGTDTSEDTLALVVCDRVHSHKSPRLVNLVCNPAYVWSEHIALSELKRALLHHSVDLAHFVELPEYQRIVLEWSW